MFADRVRMCINKDKPLFDENTKVVILGERDGLPAPAIKRCIDTIPAETVFSITETWVLSREGKLSDGSQIGVLNAAETCGAENIIVILGQNEIESAEVVAETVTIGDPTWTGVLGGVSLGLQVYHVIEPEIKDVIDPDVYDNEVGMMEMVLDVDEIIEAVKYVRENHTIYE